MKRTISIILILGILVQSCTTVRQSVISEKWYQKRDQPVGGQYDFVVLQTPSVNDKNLIIKLKYYDEFLFGKKQIIEKRRYMTFLDYYKTAVLLSLIFIAPYIYKKDSNMFESIVMSPVVGVIAAGVILPIFSIFGIVLDKANDEMKKKDGIAWGYMFTRKKVEVNTKEIDNRKILYPQGSKYKKIYLENNNITKNYTTDFSGKCYINVIKDFNLKRFYKQNENISFTVYNEKRTRIGSFSLQSQNWTIPYIEIRKPIPIYGESKTREVELGRAKPGDVFPILYEGEDLLKIQYHNQIGWIPKDAGQKFWAVPDYKK